MIYFLYYVPSPKTEYGTWLEAEVHANFETEASIDRLVSHLQQRVPELAALNIANNYWVTSVGEKPVFNYTYAFGRLEDSIYPCYVLEARGDKYFGATPIGILLSSNKPHTSALMKALGYSVPKEHLLVGEIGREDAERICRAFGHAERLVLKPAYEESSVGLRLIESEPSVVLDAANSVYSSMHAPLVLQEYIDGEDVTIPVIGRKDAIVLPAVVLKRDSERTPGPFVFEASSKSYKSGVHYENMKGYPVEIRKTGYEMAKDAFYVTRQRDYARLDFRLTDDGTCYFLEMNANPQLGLDKASFAVSAAALNLELCDVFEMIVNDDRKFVDSSWLIGEGF